MNLPNEEVRSEPPSPSGGELRNIGDVLLHAIARFPMTIVLCIAAGALTALAYGLALPNQYVSVGLLLLRLGAREQQTPESLITDDAGPRGVGVATGDELMILRNPELHERVASEIGVQRILEPYDPTVDDGPTTPWHTRALHGTQRWLAAKLTQQKLPETEAPTDLMRKAAIERLANSVSIDAQRHASTLTVSYTAHDPELAREIAGAYMRVCQERHREVYGASNELSFITAQLEEQEAARVAAEQAFQEQREEDGILNLQLTQSALAEEIQALDAQIEQDSILLESLAGQLAVIDEQLASKATDAPVETDGEPPPAGDSPAMLNSRYEWLLAQAQEVNTELAQAQKVYLEGSPLYERERNRLQGRLDSIQQELELIETRLAGLRTGVLPRTGGEPNAVYDGLVLQRVEIRRQQEGLKTAIEGRRALLRNRRVRLEELVAKEATYAKLEQDVAATTEITTRLQRALAHQRALDAIDSDESMTNLIVTQAATLPTDKEGPYRAKFLAVGLFMGFFLGLGIAIARQVLDTRLRYPKCIETNLGVRVLGVVPEESRWRRHGSRLRRPAA